MRQSYKPLNLVIVNMPFEANTVCNGCKYFGMCAAIRQKFIICHISHEFMISYLYNRLGIDNNKIQKLILNASIGILKRILEFDYPTEVKAYILDELNKRGAYQNEADLNEMRL